MIKSNFKKGKKNCKKCVILVQYVLQKEEINDYSYFLSSKNQNIYEQNNFYTAKFTGFISYSKKMQKFKVKY